MTRARKLREVLNVRLDAPLAREIARLAVVQGRTESEVARTLLGYGVEVTRRLEARSYSRPFAWQEQEAADDWERHHPGIVEIEAKFRPMTDEELIAHGLDEHLPRHGDDDWPPESQ
jgi:hypothetical protein